MATFRIPVEYRVWGLVDIEANSIEEAFKYAKNNLDELELPDRPEYVEDSFILSVDTVEDLRFYNE